MSILRPRLTLRIYLAGLAQVAVVALGFFAIAWVSRARDRAAEREANAVVERIVANLGDPDAVSREVARVTDTFDATIVIRDDRGHVIVTNRSDIDTQFPPPPAGSELPPPPPVLRRPPPSLLRDLFDIFGGEPQPDALPGRAPSALGRGRPKLGFLIPVKLPTGRDGLAFYAPKGRSFANASAVALLVLIVVGLWSVLIARSLAKPLARLSLAAGRIGAGELHARVKLARSDEIGDVARAFDEMAARIEDLVRAEKELIANVSHELRTPLARIRVALDLAAEGDPDVARQSLGEIESDLAELEQLISDVLAAARLDLATGTYGLENGTPPLHRERLDVGELVTRAADRFRAAHPDRPLEVDVPANLPLVEGDPVLLRRALENVLDNAHKYTPHLHEGVNVRAAFEAGEVCLEVRDQGAGIAPEDLANVFRPFFRADKSRSRATGGVGIGLALVKRIVEAHHGKIDIESQRGTGATVRIRLPALPEERPTFTV